MAEEEQARWGALPRLEVLDTPPDARFDRIVRLAQSIGGTPIVAISLFDRDRA